MGSVGGEGTACSWCIPKGWSWERSSSAHLPWATVPTPQCQSRDRSSEAVWGGGSDNVGGGSSCCALRRCWSRPFTCLGVPWTCWENWLLSLQQAGSDLLSKPSVKRGKLSHGVRCRQQVSVWVPEPPSSALLHVASLRAGRESSLEVILPGQVCFPWLVTCWHRHSGSSWGPPQTLPTPQHPQVHKGPGEMLCDPG